MQNDFLYSAFCFFTKMSRIIEKNSLQTMNSLIE